MPRLFRDLRIRTKLFLIIIVAGLPLIATVAALLLSKYRADCREAKHAIQVTAESIAYQHEAYIEGIRTLLITISQFPEVRRKDRDGCNRLLQGILRQNPSSHNLGIADINGELIGSGVPNSRFSIGDRKYFKDAVRTKRFSVGEYVISRAVAKPAIHFALPVLDDGGNVSIVIYATLDLNRFNRIFEAQSLPANSALNITDHKGVLLHRYPLHAEVKPGLQDRTDLRAYMTGENSRGVFNEVGRDGVKRFLAFKRLQLQPDETPYMYIRVSIPEKAVMAGTRRYLSIAVGLFVAVSLLALFCINRFMARSVVEPLERISGVSRSAKEGDFSVRSGLEYSQDEIGVLAGSFDSMSEALEARLREKERAEMELSESERRFRELLEKIHLIAVILDREGKITFCNDYLLNQTGWTRPEVEGGNWFDIFIAPDRIDEFRQMFSNAMTSASLPSHYENPIMTRSGQLRAVIWDNTLLMNADGSVAGAASIGMDVTEHRNIEAQLLQAQKMEAVGKLAGGVAHDFNNLLTPILGYAEMVQAEMAALGGRTERVERIAQAAMKARDLTKQLLSFGRKQPLDTQVIDLNTAVSSFAGILQRTVRENIEIALRLSPVPAIIRADRTQIEQIIMNLVVNSQDAIGEHGNITIETASVILDQEFARSHADVPPGRYAMLAVSDTGHGFDKETEKHIFEPFFTTKGVDRGTGLGLATVYGIVRQHGGTIWLYSEPGIGTVFKIYFPQVVEAGATALAAEEETPDKKYSSGSILLVEDDERVRRLVHELLSECGHEVVEARDTEHALELAAGRIFDLLVSDVVMPVMNGPELYARIKQLHPDQKVLFMSGYTGNSENLNCDLEEGGNFIQKPFTVEAMSRKVSSILSRDVKC